MATSRSEHTIQHVIRMHVQPARTRGEETVKLNVGTVQKELGWTNRTPSIFSTLGSGKFQREAGVELIEKRGGPPSGGPSTTVQFIYRLLPTNKNGDANVSPPANGGGLLELRGILAAAYRELGGGEAYLRQEREALQFPAESYPQVSKEWPR